MKKLLINAVTATDATKQEFTLTKDDFEGVPRLRSTGLGAGDAVTVWEYVAGVWESMDTLDTTTKAIAIESPGLYAVSVVMVLTGPASVEIETTGVV